jgi:hypothetical protein
MNTVKQETSGADRSIWADLQNGRAQRPNYQTQQQLAQVVTGVTRDRKPLGTALAVARPENGAAALAAQTPKEI